MPEASNQIADYRSRRDRMGIHDAQHQGEDALDRYGDQAPGAAH